MAESCEVDVSVSDGRDGLHAELLEQQQPVEHQIERNVSASTKPEHLDVVQPDGSARRRQVSGRRVKHAAVRSDESSLLDCDILEKVDVVDLDVCVREGAEPTRVKSAHAALPSPLGPPGARKTTSSASTDANPSISCALKVAVPVSKASRAAVTIKHLLSEVKFRLTVAHATLLRYRVTTLDFCPSRTRARSPRLSIPSLVYARARWPSTVFSVT